MKIKKYHFPIIPLLLSFSCYAQNNEVKVSTNNSRIKPNYTYPEKYSERVSKNTAKPRSYTFLLSCDKKDIRQVVKATHGVVAMVETKEGLQQIFQEKKMDPCSLKAN